MDINNSNIRTESSVPTRPLSAINKLTKMKKNDYSAKNHHTPNIILSNLNSSNQHHTNTMINHTHMADSSPKGRNYPLRIRSAANTKINYDKEKLYEENLRLKGELKKVKGELEFSKKENITLESEMGKKDKILEELMIDTQNSLLSNINSVSDGGSLNKTILGKLTETHLVTNIKKQYKELKKELKKKNEEIENYKKINKISKINEITLENKSILEEMLKLKNLYESACFKILENEKYFKDMHELQENFNKQVYLIVTLQENLKKTQSDSLMKNEQITRSNALVTEKIKKIAKMKKDLKFQMEINERLLRGNKSSNRGETTEDEKTKLLKKVSTLKKDYDFYKDLSEKRDKRIRDLESMLKIFREKGPERSELSETPSERLYKFDDNPEEKTDAKVLLLKSKLTEMKSQRDTLENENKSLNERLKLIERSSEIHQNEYPSYLYELKNDKKELEIVTEDHMNELIYILIKNFEANKIDVNIIEQRIFSDLPDFSEESFIKCFVNNLLSLLRIKNEKDQNLIFIMMKSYFTYNNFKKLENFKDKFLSLYESITYYNVDQKQVLNKTLYRKFYKHKKFLETAFDYYDEKKNGYINFISLRKILEKMKLKLRNEIIEYLIYSLKCFQDENSSITDLKWENVMKILNDENYGKPDEFDEEENPENEDGHTKRKRSDGDEYERHHHKGNETDESGIEITTEEYLKIVEGILIELTNKLYQKNLKIDDLFKPFLGICEIKETNTKTYLLELKYLVNILHDELDIKLDSVDIYCLYTKYKFEETDEEIINYDKFTKELMSLIADPNAFFLKNKADKEENSYKDFNEKNKIENLGSNNNFNTFLNMNNQDGIERNIEELEINTDNYIDSKMNSLDYLRTFLKDNKIELENLISPLERFFSKNNYSDDIFIEMKIFDEFLEEKNLFSKREFIENLPEIFTNESIRMALITKDNKINLTFLKQILSENNNISETPKNLNLGNDKKISDEDSKKLENEINNLKNKKKTIEEPKEEKKVEEKFIEKKEIESNKDKEPSLKESEYSESFKELQKELLDDSKE